MLAEVAPAIEEVPELEFGLAAAHPIDHLDGADLVRVDALSVQIELAPAEKELLAHLMAHVAVNYRVPLVVLVHHVEGLAIPYAKEKSLAINDVVAEDAVQLFDPRLEVDHDFRSRPDLLQAELFLLADVVVQDLEQQLGHERLHVLLIVVLRADPLLVHLADVRLILVA